MTSNEVVTVAVIQFLIADFAAFLTEKAQQAVGKRRNILVSPWETNAFCPCPAQPDSFGSRLRAASAAKGEPILRAIGIGRFGRQNRPGCARIRVDPQSEIFDDQRAEIEYRTGEDFRRINGLVIKAELRCRPSARARQPPIRGCI